VKLNLGCGPDIRLDCLNVDRRLLVEHPLGHLIYAVDLEVLPWPWKDGSVEKILMLDFLEHFSYRKTGPILSEAWRVLEMGGTIEVQVPDLEHCAHAALLEPPFMCNNCGYTFDSPSTWLTPGTRCECGQKFSVVQDAAIHRLYGGQDYNGNWHNTAFTKEILARIVRENGFEPVEFLEKEHQYKEWNLKLLARKVEDAWNDGK
jgi:hypothetical protein